MSISSVNALRAVSETAYTAAKGGLISMMRLVAADYAQWNIRSNVICPGTVATPASMGYWERYPAGFAARFAACIRLGASASPRISPTTLSSSPRRSRDGSTGTVHAVDGGLMGGTKLEIA